MNLTQFLPNVSVLMLAGAAFAFYIASRLGVFALESARDRNSDAAGPATLAQWLPIAAVATLAVRDMPEVSVSLIFASSVACLSLVLGTTFFSAPPTAPLESRHRRAWGMVLAAAVLALMAGFAAQFTLKHALIFALQGIVALLMWTTRQRDPASDDADQPPFASVVPIGRASSPAGMRIASLIGWLLLTLAGAWVAIRATDRLTHEVPRLTGGLIAALMISPALVLPIIGSSLNWAREGRPGLAVSCAAGCTLLNLCLLLPVVIVVSGWWKHRGGDVGDAALAFPMAVWRIDTSFLIVLGTMLLVFSTGRWVPRRAEVFGLLLA
jgi:Ca2+/Na+ antiporter